MAENTERFEGGEVTLLNMSLLQKTMEELRREQDAFAELYQQAEEGDAGAAAHLGVRYLSGKGTEKAPEKAVPWLQQAAENDDPYATARRSSCSTPRPFR